VVTPAIPKANTPLPEHTPTYLTISMVPLWTATPQPGTKFLHEQHQAYQESFMSNIKLTRRCNQEWPPRPTFARTSQNVAVVVALLDTLPTPSADGVDKVYR
jgi:hypothetical protein